MLRFEDVLEGAELPGCDRVVRREDVRAYAEASGDRNPLHQDDAFAQAAGFDGIIAHGMFTMGHLAQCLVDWIGDPSPITHLRVTFRSPVFMDETIHAGGRVKRVDPERRTATLDLWVTVARDGSLEHPIRRGEADLRFP